jgi:hypothetical protein
MSDQRFWVSTGDIREEYEVLNVVGAVSDATFITVPDFSKVAKNAVDALALEAQKIGANGVIWIDIKPIYVGGFIVYATGTAVIVKPSS